MRKGLGPRKRNCATSQGTLGGFELVPPERKHLSLRPTTRPMEWLVGVVVGVVSFLGLRVEGGKVVVRANAPCGAH